LATEAFVGKLQPNLLYEMLDGIRIIEEDGVRFPDQYDLSEAFKCLEAAGDLDDEKLAVLEFAYIPALQFSERGFAALSRQIAAKPEVFFEFVKLSYKGRNDNRDSEPTDQERSLASNAWTALHYCKRIPGLRKDGSVDKNELLAWAASARKFCRDADREVVGDQTIGQFLSHAVVGSDGVWPTEGVRDLLDLDDADEIRKGFQVGTLNNRGVTSRTYDEGGAQERELARKFHKNAAALANTYPRLAATIATIQAYYESEARREDLDANLRIEGQ
jgi:hypothetical protein